MKAVVFSKHKNKGESTVFSVLFFYFFSIISSMSVQRNSFMASLNSWLLHVMLRGYVAKESSVETK